DVRPRPGPARQHFTEHRRGFGQRRNTQGFDPSARETQSDRVQPHAPDRAAFQAQHVIHGGGGEFVHTLAALHPPGPLPPPASQPPPPPPPPTRPKGSRSTAAGPPRDWPEVPAD